MTRVQQHARRYVREMADLTFQRALDEGIEPNCRRTPDAWKYYVGFTPSNRPSAEGAERLCAGCPLYDACRAFAHNLPSGVADGVWGGQVWIDGVIQAD